MSAIFAPISEKNFTLNFQLSVKLSVYKVKNIAYKVLREITIIL